VVGWINIAMAAITIAVGFIGFLNPRYVMETLNLATDGSTFGLSEIRAASGAVFVGMGGVAILLGAPWAYFMIGVLYASAGMGRLLSIILDGSGPAGAYGFLAFEVLFAGWFIAANWSAVRS